MTAAEKLDKNGFGHVVVFSGEYTYDSALIGVTQDYRAIYDFEKMIDWMMKKESVDRKTALNYVDMDTLSGVQDISPDGPIVMYQLSGEECE